MKRLRLVLIVAAALVIGLIVAQPGKASFSTLQDQIAVTIVVDVSPSPIAYAPHHSLPIGSSVIAISGVSLKPIATFRRAFHADSLQFIGGSTTIAQAGVQHGILVQAQVTPNPKGTLLYSNQNVVTIPNAVAGARTQLPCAFTVTVDSTKSWTLDEGLSNDFKSDFSGTTLANNTYVATPQPTSTPYVVYADDGSKWSLAGTGAVMTTYCVTLTVTVPGSVLAGSYSTNAIYSLYF